MSLEVEQKLVEEAQRDPERFTALYDKYFEPIYRYVKRRIEDRDTAEDVVSQTFFDAFNNLKRYEFRGLPFSAWLYKIAHNNVLKWYREKGKAIVVDIDEAQHLAHSDDVNVTVKLQENQDVVKQILGQMNFEDQELLRLKFFEDLSNIEIAEVMGLTANNVGVKLYRSLQRFKQLLNT
jgi:RNA polymerase sigma-70 factor (ECF subfamily)